MSDESYSLFELLDSCYCGLHKEPSGYKLKLFDTPKDNTYIFELNEVFNKSFSSPDEIYDALRPLFDNVLIPEIMQTYKEAFRDFKYNAGDYDKVYEVFKKNVNMKSKEITEEDS